jgi:hypothetical protein
MRATPQQTAGRVQPFSKQVSGNFPGVIKSLSWRGPLQIKLCELSRLNLFRGADIEHRNFDIASMYEILKLSRQRNRREGLTAVSHAFCFGDQRN